MSKIRRGTRGGVRGWRLQCHRHVQRLLGRQGGRRNSENGNGILWMEFWMEFSQLDGCLKVRIVDIHGPLYPPSWVLRLGGLRKAMIMIYVFFNIC